MPTFTTRLLAESGLLTLLGATRDTYLLCLARLVRLFAYGTTFLILVHFLSSLDISDSAIGLFMTLTLLGDVIISFVLTTITDQVGRRLVLAVGAGLMVFSGVVFALSSSYWLLVLASVLGVISPSGNEIGPFRAVEESVLAQLTAKDVRSDIFAWYTLFGTAGAALGTVTSGWVVEGLQRGGWSAAQAYRVVFWGYAVLGGVKLGLVWLLSPQVEVERAEAHYEEVAFELDEDGGLLSSSEDEDSDDGLHGQPRTEPSIGNSAPRSAPPISRPSSTLWQRFRSLLPPISTLSVSILWRLLLLFTLDSFASGLASPSWLTYFFTTIHSLAAGTLGTLFFITNLLATISNLLALPLARRLGPLKTMVFTHLPSAIFLSLIPFPTPSPSGTWLAMAFLALRACTQSMDQAPRQAFIAAAVLPAERTAVLGVVNIVKTLAQAGGMGSAGVLASKKWWIVVLGGAGAMKAAYDLLMLWMFLGLKDREGKSGRDSERDEERG